MKSESAFEIGSIPDQEQADHATSPVTAEEMAAALKALHEEVEGADDTADILEVPGHREDVPVEIETAPSATAAENLETQKPIESQVEKAETDVEKIARIKEDIGRLPPTGGKSAVGEDGWQPERKPLVWHITDYERPHGSTFDIMGKAFGTGLKGVLNLFRPSAWKKYNQMLKEHNDPALLKTTHRTELGGHYLTNLPPENKVEDVGIQEK